MAGYLTDTTAAREGDGTKQGVQVDYRNVKQKQGGAGRDAALEQGRQRSPVIVEGRQAGDDRAGGRLEEAEPPCAGMKRTARATLRVSFR